MLFDEKHNLIRKLARQFAETELTKEVLDKIEETHVFPEEILTKMAEAGFFGIKGEKCWGGQGGDTLAYSIVMEEFARVSAVSTIYISQANSLSTGPLMLAGTDEQKEKYMRPVLEGKKRLAFGLTEPGAGSDAGAISTTADKDGEYYILNGRKCFITMAPLAHFIIIFAKTDVSKGTRGITAFLVDMDTPGVECGKPEDKMGVIGCATSDVILDHVKVHKSQILGQEGKGFSIAMSTLSLGRLGIASQSIGVAQGCLDEAIRYAKERKQFGKRIGDFQGISFMLAEMATKLQAAKELTYNAAVLRDAGQEATMECSMAKLFAAETCKDIARDAVQIHGGYGVIKDYKVERMFRDSCVFSIYEGTSQVQKIVISKQLMK